MIDAHQSCRPGRYCRYTAHPQWNRPLFHVPQLRAGADCTEIACSGLTESQASRGGECSPDPGCGFQNSDDRIHVGGSGYITRPFHPCGTLRRLKEVHGQFPVARLRHTGDSSAGSAGALRLQGSATDELPEPADKLVPAPNPHPGLNPKAGERTSVRDARTRQIADPGNSPKKRPLPTWPGLRWGWPTKTLFPASPIPFGYAVTFHQRDHISKPGHSRRPEAITSRVRAT